VSLGIAVMYFCLGSSSSSLLALPLPAVLAGLEGSHVHLHATAFAIGPGLVASADAGRREFGV
jgi:hypothetical protein